MKHRLLKTFSFIMMVAIFISSTQVTLSCIASDLHMNESVMDQTLTEITDPVNIADTSEYEEEAYIIGEDEALRKENEKHFRLSDGTYIAVAYAEPVHYMDDGEWKDIDNTLTLTDDGYVNTANDFTVTFGTESTSSELYTLTDGEHTVKMYLKEQSSNGTSTYALRPSSNREIAVKEITLETVDSFEVMSSADSVKEFKEKNPNATDEQISEIVKDQNEENKRQREFMMKPKNVNSSLEFTDIIGNVDIEYVVTSTSVKENIILESVDDGNVFEFVLDTELDAVLNDDGTIDLKDGDEIIFSMPAPYMYDANGVESTDVEYSLATVDGNTVLTVTADEEWINDSERAFPVTIDPTVSSGKTDGVDYRIITQYISDADLVNAHQGEANWKFGYVPSVGNYYSYIKVDYIPVIPYNCSYAGAEIHFQMRTGGYVGNGASEFNIMVQKALAGNWTNQFGPTGAVNNNQLIDCISVSENSEGKYVLVDVGNIAKEWIEESYYNTGLVLTTSLSNGEEMTDTNYATATFNGYINSTTATTNMPYFALYYQNNVGIEGYYTYHSASARRAGSVYINDFTGNLTLSRNLISGTGADVSYIYNSPYGGQEFTTSNGCNTVDYSNMKTATGWKLNLQQSVVEKTLTQHNGSELSSVTYLIYTDADGTEHYFTEVADNLFEDEDGLGLEIIADSASSMHTMLDMSYNQMIFIHGYLSQIIDQNGNKVVLLYDTETYSDSSTNWHPKSSTSGGKNQLRKVIYIPDGEDEITVATLTYDAVTKRLTSVTDRTGRTVELEMTGDRLTKIIDYDETEMIYCYDTELNGLVTAYDSESEYGLSFEYNYYDLGQVVSYCDFTGNTGSEDSVSPRTIQNIISAFYTGRKTTFTHAGADKETETEDDIVTTYSFDIKGRTITSRTADQSGATISVSGATYATNSNTSKLNNKLLSTGSTGAISQNLLRYTGIEESGASAVWPMRRSSSATQLKELSSTEVHTGNKSLKLYSTATGGWATMYQTYSLTSSGTYTFSAYIKVTEMSPATSGNGVRVSIEDSSGNDLATSRFITAVTPEEIDDGWVKLSCTYNAEATGSIRACIDLVGVEGVVYVDDVQLEKNETSSPYNLVQNGDLSRDLFWTFSSDNVTRATIKQPNGSAGRVIKIIGSPHAAESAEQTINVNLPGTETYLLSGWAKANSLPALNEDTRTFQITATITYSDGEIEYHQNPYSYYTWNQWQYVCVPIVPDCPGKTVSTITVTCSYKYNGNVAYFDDISLIREPAQEYSYDAEGRVTAVNTTDMDQVTTEYYDDTNDVWKTDGGASGQYVYTYDNNHNVDTVTNDGIVVSYNYDDVGNVKDTIITDFNGTYMATSALYTDGGTRILSAKDNLNNTVSYTYNDEYLLASTTTPVSNSMSANGSTATTNYTYYSSDRTHMAYETGKAALVYSYDKGSTSSVMRKGFLTAGNGNGIEQTYSFTYNDYGQRLSAKIGDMTLSTNTYDSATHNLTMTSYAANGNVEYTYDKLDRLKTVKYNSIDTLVTYSYDYMGNVSVVRVTDSTGETEYVTYYYEFDSHGRQVRYLETCGDEVKQQMQYTYDSKGRSDSVTYFDGAETNTIVAVYDDENGGALLRYDYGGEDGAIGYYYDGFNRVNRKYYRRSVGASANDWQVFYAFKNGNETNRTTSLVSQLKYQLNPNDESKNYIFNYTYDNLGNITKITRVENNGAEETVAKYVYDENSQLVVESVYDADAAYSMVYTYDTYGNLRSAKKYSGGGFTSPDQAVEYGTLLDTETYSYTNSNWKDLLTSYDGHSITYDAMGNPLSYYNGQDYTFTWENGKQLASTVMDGKTVTYEYNIGGVRTQKTVDGVTYNYRLLGDKVAEMTTTIGGVDYRYVFVYDENGNPHELHYYYNGASTPTEYYYVLNLQGDVVQLRDASNTVVANYSYDSWGKLVAITDANGNAITSATSIGIMNPLRYRGYFYDNETKLYYCNSRYYDPQIRRFINADALMSTDTGFLGFNMFAYCNNNPVMYYDPSGNIVTEWDRTHLSAEDIKVIEECTVMWETAKINRERIHAHYVARRVRENYIFSDKERKNTTGYELVLPDGNVISDVYSVVYVFGDYSLSVDIRPTAISVNVTSDAFRYIQGNGDLDLLACMMLHSYRSFYGFDFEDRTMDGLAVEMEKHMYIFDDWDGTLLQGIAERGRVADLENSYYIGTQNYKIFEQWAELWGY